MRIRVKLDKQLIKSIVSFASEYLEVSVVGSKALLFCEENNNYIRVPLSIVDSDNEFQHIRFPKSLLSNLKTEEVLDIIILDGIVKFSFYGQNSIHQYTITIEKQRGVVDYTFFLDLEDSKLKFEKVDLLDYSNLIFLLSKLKTVINSLDNVMWGEFNRGYIYMKSVIPNFSIPAENLLKLINLNTTVYFISNYLYAECNDVSMFMCKFRVPKSCDLLDSAKQHFTHSLTLNTSVIKNVITRFNIDNEASIELNFSKSILTIINQSNTLEIDVHSSNIKSKELQNENEDSLLLSLNSKSSSLDISSIENPHRIPNITIPKWVLINFIRLPEIRVLISNNFVRMTLDKLMIIYPGGGK